MRQDRLVLVRLEEPGTGVVLLKEGNMGTVQDLAGLASVSSRLISAFDTGFVTGGSTSIALPSGPFLVTAFLMTILSSWRLAMNARTSDVVIADSLRLPKYGVRWRRRRRSSSSRDLRPFVV